MSTQVTNENAVTTTITKPKPMFVGGTASIFWHTLEDLAFVGEVWATGDKVRLALVTRSFAEGVDPVTQRYLTAEQRGHLLAQKSIRKSDRMVSGGFFFGPWCVDLSQADPEQEVGGLLAYSGVSGRLLFFVRANPGTYTDNKSIRVRLTRGIYAQVRA